MPKIDDYVQLAAQTAREISADELYAMFEAKHIDPEAMASGDVQQGSKYGKNFARLPVLLIGLPHAS